MESAEVQTVTVGLVADPGPPRQIAQKLADRLPRYFAEHVSDEVEWNVHVSHDPRAFDFSDGTASTTTARARMPAEGWDLRGDSGDGKRGSSAHVQQAGARTT